MHPTSCPPARPGAPLVSEPAVAPDQGVDPEFAAFFVAVLPRTVAAARRITGDLASAEDAASEALARAFLHWPKLRLLPHRHAWVLRVATNEAVGMLRTRTRREAILRRQPPPSPTGHDDMEGREVLLGRIRRLPRRQRQVVLLRFYADLTTDEAASTLGISAGSVKSHLHRAVGTLRDELGTDLTGGTIA
jgi:RNA polymerase sigma-70 factor (sigma-E family)